MPKGMCASAVIVSLDLQLGVASAATSLDSIRCRPTWSFYHE